MCRSGNWIFPCKTEEVIMTKANLDWPNLDFGYRDTDYNIRFTWRNSPASTR